MSYTIGLDYGTNSVRCLVVRAADGAELGSSVYGYPTGKSGIILDANDHNVARQNPSDYLEGAVYTVSEALKEAQINDKDFNPSKVLGIGIDTTGSSPMPIDENGTPLCMLPQFKDNINAYTWLWKDHTSFAEAAEITALAKDKRPEYLAKCGGTYSSEWFFSKILHCLRIDSEVFDAAYTWVEYCDWLTASFTGNEKPQNIVRSRCAAGHKAMFSSQWGGLPDTEFLSTLDSKLGDLRNRLYEQTQTIDTPAGRLTAKWAEKLGLNEGVVVAVAAFDCHLGAVGAGVCEGTMVKVMGTSTCDIMVYDTQKSLVDIPGVCGIVDGSVLPGCFGIEAGQSAVGDIFNWFVNGVQPYGKDGSFAMLDKAAANMRAGQSGLLALDWNNGNRTVLVDQRLTGLLVGQTLHTKPEEIYRALIEATAFGALTIINRIEEYGVKIDTVINCGGIAEKSPIVMQIYADVINREMKISRSPQTCALGSAIAAAVVSGCYSNFADAQKAMTGIKDTVYKPIPENVAIYAKLYKLYR